MGVSTSRETRDSTAHDHGFHALRVRRVVPETAEAVSLVFDVPPELAETFGYAAGQFLTFRLNIDGRQLLRSYSMSSSPGIDPELQVTVKRVAGGVVSNWIADELSPGDVVESTRPAGVFCLGPGDGDIVAFAGGSGITPVYSLLKTALSTTSRRVRLLYANRDREAAIFADELDTLATRFPGRLEVVHHFDAVSGFVDDDAIRRHAAPPDSEVFICGPGPFMELIERTLYEGGLDTGRVHIERFTPLEPDVLESDAAAPAPAATETAEVTIELDGKVSTTQHRPGTTILQTARQMGMTPPSSCEAGDCATCMARMVEGTAQMRANNSLLEDEVEEGWVLTCQAVPDPPSVHVIYGYGDD